MTTEKAQKLNVLIKAMVDLEVAGTLAATAELIAEGAEPVEIMTACEQALTVIGDRYASGEYFIAGLIMAGELMNRIINLVTPLMSANIINMLRGRVIIGTVKGDIHGLGKNIAGALLSAYGFEVHDLGVDVPSEEFVAECKAFKPDIVGLSVLLTSCYSNLGDTIKELKQFRGQAKKPAIFISGAQLTPTHQKYYGADHFADTAFDTVRLCEKIVRRGLDNNT